LAERMKTETSTRFVDWLDHLVVSDEAAPVEELRRLGFARQPIHHGVGAAVYAHEGAVFPRLVVASGSGPRIPQVAIKVEGVAAFARAHDLGLEIRGYAMGPYRFATIGGKPTTLGIVERRGYLGFDPFPGEMAREGRMRPHAARDALAARELWQGRRRRFDDD